MSEFSEIINKYSIRYRHKINKFCDHTLNNFGVDHFWYFKISNDGFYTCLGKNIPWMEYYFSEKLYLSNPYLKNPENFETSIHVVRKGDDYSYQKSIHMGIRNFTQSLIFLEKARNGIEGYGFASYLPKEVFEYLCIRLLSKLHL